MKALVVTRKASPETSDVNRLASCFASLDALGIQFSRALAEYMPSAAAVNEYDFIVFPQLNAGAFQSNVINNSAYTIPMFGLNAAGAVTNFGSTPGVSGDSPAITNEFMDVPFTVSEFVAANARPYTLTTGKALMTVSATEPNIGSFTGAAQVNAGKVVAWRTDTAGGNYLYLSSKETYYHHYLPMLIAEAIKDGVLGAAPRRAPIFFNIDHINGTYTHLDTTIPATIASYVQKGGVIWCGQQDDLPSSFENMSPEVAAELKRLSYPNGPFKYCYHNHKQDITSGTYPNAVELVDKATQDDMYQYGKAIWEGHGLEYHMPAFYDPGNNAWTESTMELFCSDTTSRQSRNNDTTQKGYGFRVFRCIRKSTRAQPARGNIFHNQFSYEHSAHGMLILATWDMAQGTPPYPDRDMPYDSVIDYRDNFSWLCKAVSMGFILYFHDADFSPNRQSPGIEEHGIKAMEIIAGLGNYYKETILGFADPIDYYPDKSISLA